MAVADAADEVRIALNMWPQGHARIRLLPYAGGKSFAFSIVDDTDRATLETVRPVYDYLFSLGLRTTKTVWASKPEAGPATESDSGDTLEREDYAAYIQLLRQRGFEIALHGVSSQSSRRAHVIAGMERLRALLGDYSKINVYHEKSQDNLHFEYAQHGVERAPSFRTAAFRTLARLVRRDRPDPVRQGWGCSGENPASPYFWGDICRMRIKYVRTNVFFQDLNTLKCNPLTPYSSTETPYVNYWFDSSNGQDLLSFNSILSDRNIAKLKAECGCSILYTHFGKGFVTRFNGLMQIHAESRRRLRAIAADPDGWYAPAGEILDRLLAFQRVALYPLPGGVVLANRNDFAVRSVTLLTPRGRSYCVLDTGEAITADDRGRAILPALPAGRLTALVRRDGRENMQRWYETSAASWRPIWRRRWEGSAAIGITMLDRIIEHERQRAAESILRHYRERYLPHAVLVPSARFGLYAAAKELLPPAASVLVSPITCRTAIQALLAAGVRPVFVDIEPETGNIDIRRLTARSLRRGQAIVTTNLYGNPDSVWELKRIAEAHSMLLIEDCAHVLHTTIAGQSVGSAGDVSVFSFKKYFDEPGGVVTLRNEAAARRVETLLACQADIPPESEERARYLQFLVAQRVSPVLGARLSAMYGRIRPSAVISAEPRPGPRRANTLPTTAAMLRVAGTLSCFEQLVSDRITGARALVARCPLELKRSPHAGEVCSLAVPFFSSMRDAIVAEVKRHGIPNYFLYSPPMNKVFGALASTSQLDNDRIDHWCRNILPIGLRFSNQYLDAIHALSLPAEQLA